MNESKLMDLLNSSDYVPTYEDKDGDWMLVGDVPWEQVFIYLFIIIIPLETLKLISNYYIVKLKNMHIIIGHNHLAERARQSGTTSTNNENFLISNIKLFYSVLGNEKRLHLPFKIL